MPKVPRFSSKDLIFGLMIAFLIVVSVIIAMLIGLTAGKKGVLSRLPIPLPAGRVSILGQQKFELAQTDQWIDCGGIRDSLIEEADRLYLACEGGVLVISPQGKVLDQFSMADGLKNNFINSLIKHNGNLYVGHQDGFSIINLTNRAVKNISVGEGLINGSNITMARDGNDLWIGTFDGIAKYNMATAELKNYHQELRAIGSKLSNSGILVTSKAVYFNFNAHVASSGGIARYDKATGQFETVGLAKFPGKTRLDLQDMIAYDGVILVSDWSGIWIAEDKPNADWVAYEDVQGKIQSLVGREHPLVKVIGFKDGMPLILSENLIIGYNLQTREVKVIYPEGWEGHGVINVIAQAGHPILAKNVVWFNKGLGLNLIRFNLNDFSNRTITLQDRPSSFNSMLALINDTPVFTANSNEVWQMSVGGFEKIISGSGSTIGDGAIFGGIPGSAAFSPIIGTPNVLVYFQACGQGCEKPRLTIFNYPDGTLKPIELSNEVVEKLGGDQLGAWSYGQLTYLGLENGIASFQTEYSNPPIKAQYDMNSNKWTVTPTVPVDVAQLSQIRCNPDYVLNNRQFSLRSPCLTTLNGFSWQIENPNGRSALRQTEVATGKSTVLTPTLAERRYSPFSTDFYIPSYSHGQIAEGKFWLATNLGLPSLDPISGSWQLIDTRSGLVTNEILNFVVGSKAVWAVTENGGLAGIKR